MGFWGNLFGARKKAVSEGDTVKESLPEIKESEFIDNSDPNEEDKVSVVYGTSMPIDIIYQYLKEDFETKGYEDALCNPDSSYKEMNKQILRNNLEVKLQQVKLRYSDDLKELEFHIDSRSKAGLVDIVEQLKTRHSILAEHLSIIEKMEQELADNTGYMTGMLLSYDRGFLRGLGALSLDKIKSRES